mmetsp:Transcript_34441/g.90938  ORF Transcript_34441/g.90938 Transcript_34441/m.90938 type:complete len:92 (-) Transcript_34441:255-530(-)
MARSQQQLFAQLVLGVSELQSHVPLEVSAREIQQSGRMALLAARVSTTPYFPPICSHSLFSGDSSNIWRQVSYVQYFADCSKLARARSESV